MCFLPRPVKLPFDVTIERSHHADPGEHRRATALGNQQKRLHRGLPFCGIVFGLGELGDVEGGVLQCDQLAALCPWDRLFEFSRPSRAGSLPHTSKLQTAHKRLTDIKFSAESATGLAASFSVRQNSSIASFGTRAVGD
jgi:hypothetical protein